MPLALIAIGALLLISALRGTHKQLGAQLQKDFTGSGNFVYWVIALAVVGSIGYIPKFDKFSKAFMGLIIVVIFLSNKGFFAQFTQAVGSGSTAPSNPTEGSNIPGFGAETGKDLGSGVGGAINSAFKVGSGLIGNVDLGGFL